MKKLLKKLYKKSKRDFEVWNYLWLFSENNSIDFTLSELGGRFNLPPSSLHRILNIYPEQWNEEKVFVEYTRKAYKQYNVKFHPNGKKIEKSQIHTIYDSLFDWIKEYYIEIEYEYTDISTHKKYIKIISDKLTKAMKSKKSEVTDETVSNTFKFLISNIPDWWRENGNLTLPQISKHFTKIVNQVKTNNGGTKKRDSYSKAANDVDEIDFTQLTRKS
jgi:hypothetical protein